MGGKPEGEKTAWIQRSEDRDRTLDLAALAVEQIKALGQAPDPRTYEFWYTFAHGDNGSLRKAVEEHLVRKGKISPHDVEELYAAHIAATAGIPEKVGKLGSQVADEIDQVMAMIDAVQGSASHYSESLSGASERLGGVRDRQGLRAIVESLVGATRDMEASNVSLQAKLRDVWHEVSELRQALDAVRKESLTDALTSLGNRKYFDKALVDAIVECRAKRGPLCLILADVDHFKQINDTYGHVVGDRVLRFVAQTMERNIKGQDVAARYGGEEFAIILPYTLLRDAVTVGEQIRAAVMSKELEKRSTGERCAPLTISMGVAALQPDGSAQSLIESADACLYAAKRSGRNRVVAETDEQILAAVAKGRD